MLRFGIRVIIDVVDVTCRGDSVGPLMVDSRPVYAKVGTLGTKSALLPSAPPHFGTILGSVLTQLLSTVRSTKTETNR